MRRLVSPFVATLLAIVAFAGPATAAVRHHRARCQNVVRLVYLPGGGTLIRVQGAGTGGRTFVLSPVAIAAAAVRDVDQDGDLDIIASGGDGLVVWRNLGAGRYALAPAPGKRTLPRRSAPGLAPSRLSVQSSGIGEQRLQLVAAGGTLTRRVAPAVAPATSSPALVRSHAARAHSGRAPPAGD